MPKLQRQTQRLHVIAIAAQNGLGLRQELLFFKTGMGGVGLHQLLHRSHVQISRAGSGQRFYRWFQVFPAHLVHAA